MSIATVDDVVSGLTAKQARPFFKTFSAPKGAGAFQSGWLATGIPGAGAAAPAYTAGSGYACSGTTAGALAYTNGAVQNWLAKAFACITQPGILIVADRLWSCSGMGFASGTYTVTTPGNLPARVTDGGIGAELWVENFVAAGAASGVLTANYKNELGATKAGTIAAVVSAPVIGQMQPVSLQTGDKGISQLTSVGISATWTSGSFGMTIAERLAEIEVVGANLGKTMDWASLGLPQIPADACLMFIFLANSATVPVVLGRLEFIDK
jgi:hypothetical protein